MKANEKIANEKINDAIAISKLEISLAQEKKYSSQLREYAHAMKSRLEAAMARLTCSEALKGKLEAECARLTDQAKENGLAQARFRSEAQLWAEKARSLSEEVKVLRQDISRARAETSAIDQTARRLQMELIRAREENQVLRKTLSEDRDAKVTAITALREENLVLQQKIHFEKRQLQKLAQKLLAEWGADDVALRVALEAIQKCCEVQVVTTEPGHPGYSSLNAPIIFGFFDKKTLEVSHFRL